MNKQKKLNLDCLLKQYGLGNTRPALEVATVAPILLKIPCLKNTTAKNPRLKRVYFSLNIGLISIRVGIRMSHCWPCLSLNNIQMVNQKRFYFDFIRLGLIMTQGTIKANLALLKTKPSMESSAARSLLPHLRP